MPEETKKIEKTPAEKFVDSYNKLVKDSGFTIVPIPQFLQRDDGTFSVVIKTSVQELPKTTQTTETS